MKRRSAAVMLAVLSSGWLGTPVHAQTFPTQAVHLISPFPVGSGPDVIARMVGQRMAAVWNQSVVVEPRPGANGFLAAGAVRNAGPHGHELLVADVGVLAISPSLFKSLPYDPKGDFVPVGGIYRTSFFIVVGAASPIQSVRDLAAAASRGSGKLSYGSNAVGGPLHLGGAQIEAATGTSMLHVPFKETAQLYQAVATGEVDFALASLATAGPLLKAGKLRLLAVADEVRSEVQPTVPTFLESGGPRAIKVQSWVALMAPRGTAPATVRALNQTLNDVLRQGDLAEKFAQFGFVPFAMTPQELSTLIGSETVFYADMVRRTGANAN